MICVQMLRDTKGVRVCGHIHVIIISKRITIATFTPAVQATP